MSTDKSIIQQFQGI